MVYARNSWKATMIDAGLDQPEAAAGCPLATTYSPMEAEELLKDFLIVDMRQDHIFPYSVERYVNHEYRLEPWFAAMPAEMFEALKRSFGWHLLIRAVPS